MAKKNSPDGLQPDGSLIFSVILPPEIAKRFMEAMKVEDREHKAEFGRLLIKRALLEAEERRAFEEFKKLRQAQPAFVPHISGEAPQIVKRETA